MLAIRLESTKDSLVLLDELGTGTDPQEGAALGIAVVRALVAAGKQVRDTFVTPGTLRGEQVRDTFVTPRTLRGEQVRDTFVTPRTLRGKQ
eukprot:592380-Prorocentrum_minimum.AAC.1